MKKNRKEEQVIDFDLNEFEDDFDEEDLDMEEMTKFAKLRAFARNHKKGVVATLVITVVTVAIAVVAPGLTAGDESVDADEAADDIAVSDNTEAE